MTSSTYTLLDSGSGRKLEQFGPYLISRKAPQAIHAPRLSKEIWESADAIFSDDQWVIRSSIPSTWTIEVDGLVFQIKLTDAGHLGIFPEQRPLWRWIKEKIAAEVVKRPVGLLNLFAYTGGSTLAAAAAGASVCHV